MRHKNNNGLIYLLTAIGLTMSGSSTVHIYTQKYTVKQNETEYTERNIHNNKKYINITRIHNIQN